MKDFQIAQREMRRNINMEEKYELVANVQQAALTVQMAHTQYEKTMKDNYDRNYANNLNSRASSRLRSIYI